MKMNSTSDVEHKYNGKRVLITGGLGMIGSTIARKIVKAGAKVTIVDACIEPYGANFFNVHDIRDALHVNIADIRDREGMKILVRDMDIIFNLAGQVSHNDSIADPYLDADINYIGHLNVLENVRIYNPTALVVHAGSRLQFGAIQSVPVDEKQPLKPKTPYALNKTAAENLYLFYYEVHNIRCVIFRIANPYGPRSQMKHHKYSMVNWFIRQAMENHVIRVFGDGQQLRDYIHVEDLADAFISAAVTDDCAGEVFNVGSGVGTKFKDMAEMILNVVGSGSIEYVPWPTNYINVETGDYITDIKKICSATGWMPQVDLERGIKSVYEYYNMYRSYYW
jgi:UDP-glucose 4-epimerase